MTTVDEVIREGKIAQRIMGDSVFEKAVLAVDERTLQDWRDAETVEEREQAHADHRALQRLLGELERLISDGEYAQEMLERQR